MTRPMEETPLDTIVGYVLGVKGIVEIDPAAALHLHSMLRESAIPSWIIEELKSIEALEHHGSKYPHSRWEWKGHPFHTVEDMADQIFDRFQIIKNENAQEKIDKTATKNDELPDFVSLADIASKLNLIIDRFDETLRKIDTLFEPTITGSVKVDPFDLHETCAGDPVIPVDSISGDIDLDHFPSIKSPTPES